MTHSEQNAPAAKVRAVIGTFVLFAVLLASDLLVKRAAQEALKNGPIVLIPGVFRLVLVENRGAAFGILSGQRWLISLLGAAFLGAAAWLVLRLPADRFYTPLRVTAAFLAAGAAGNLWDRLALGYVRDYLYFELIDFPVFNLADIYVVCASFAAVLLLELKYRETDFSFLIGRKKSDDAAK